LRKHVIQFIDRGVAIAACTLLVALLIAVTSGILSRAVGRPFTWTDEAASYLMVWVSMFGWMVATRRMAHIRIRFFNDMLPTTGRRVLEVAFLAIAAGLGILVAWQGAHLVAVNLDVETITLHISTAWLYAPLIPAGLVMAGQAITEIINLRVAPSTLSHEARP
jgi:TRAP-type transport system small permease protein